MAQKKELHIEISPTGEVKVTVKCVDGQSCVDETKFLEQALGNTVLEEGKTADYYKQQVEESVTTKTGG